MLLIPISNCGTLSDVGKTLRNEKINTTDEFLIKKKKPLTEPPDLTELPEPKIANQNKELKNNEIKEILNVPEDENKSNKSKSSSTEESILGKIKK